MWPSAVKIALSGRHGRNYARSTGSNLNHRGSESWIGSNTLLPRWATARTAHEQSPVPGEALRHLPMKGVYVFYEQGKPMYVGRAFR